MEVKKIRNEYDSFDIILEENNKQLKMFFMGNLDLYWSIYDYNKTNESKVLEFTITKIDYCIYELFDVLYNRVKNCEVKKIDDVNIYMCLSIEELKDYLKIT